MSLPGLSGLQAVSAEKHTVQLAAQSEWRFEVGFESKLIVRLLDGTAEMFGTELARGQEYEFIGKTAAIYTWEGAKLEYSGPVHEYTSDNTPMSNYVNLHFGLESQRQRVPQGQPSPVILIVGPLQSGKTSICKTLVSYASKVGRSPILVSLDPKNAVSSPPGVISATSISDILDVEQEWAQSMISGPSLSRPTQPLIYTYGLDAIEKNPRFYKHITSQLSLAVSAKAESDPKIKASGVIIDTPSAFSNLSDGPALVARAVADFNVTVIAVVGHERLYSELSKRFKDKNISLLNLPRSGGVVEHDSAYTRKLDHRSIQQYFYGIPRQVLSPFTVTARFSDLTVYKVLELSDASSETLPEDHQEATKPEFLQKIEPSSALENSILAVLNASITANIDTLSDTETQGFVHISSVDEQKKIVKMLLPVPGRAPNKPLLLGDYRYLE